MSPESTVRVVVGLGNPGARYEGTRHNVGFWLADELAQTFGAGFRPASRFFGDLCRILVEGRECWLLKPTTYMNRSGQSVAAFAGYYGIAPYQLLVVHDELDLEPGVVRLKRGGGHAGHNGLRDLLKALGGPDFLRLRVGIGHPGDKDAVVDYVLGRPSRDDEANIRTALGRAAGLLPLILDGHHQQVMNSLHGAR